MLEHHDPRLVVVARAAGQSSQSRLIVVADRTVASPCCAVPGMALGSFAEEEGRARRADIRDGV
jgi:hypothetical protein